MTITIPDALADQYQAFDSRKSIDAICTRQLERFAAYPFGDRLAIVSGEDRERLERLTHCSLGEGGRPLMDAIEEIASIHIGHVRVDLPPKLLEALANRARFTEQPIDKVIEETVTEVADQMLAQALY